MTKTTGCGPPHSSALPAWHCVTCGQEASENFCPHCGEKQREDHDFSLKHILSEAVEAFFHVDSKVFRTLKTLVKSPGRLTAEFFLGRRKPYMSPLQTFFVCNLFFFLLQPLTGLEILAPPLRAFENNTFLKPVATRLVEGRMAKLHLSPTDPAQLNEFTARFDRVCHLQAKSLVLVLTPMLAVLLAALHLGRRRYFSEHLIFSLHAYAWWLLWLLLILAFMSAAIIVAQWAGHSINIHWIDLCATLLEFGGLGLYLFFADRAFYRDKLLFGITRGVVLTFCVYGLFHLYRLLLLFTVLYSL
jgi:hypothetical protein